MVCINKHIQHYGEQEMPHTLTAKYKVISGKSYNNLAEWKADYNGGPTITTEWALICDQHCSFSTSDQTMTRVVTFKSDDAKKQWQDTKAGWGDGDTTLQKTAVWSD